MSSAPQPASAVLRLSRAVVFATACVAVSAAGHVLAGGGMVPFEVCLGGVLAALGLAYAIDGRERGLPAVLAATTATQMALHQIFERQAPWAGAEQAHGHPAPGMALVHLTVAGLTAWWLHRGERALWLMIHLYGVPLPSARLLVPVPVTEIAAPPSWRPVTHDVFVCAVSTVSRAITRRGPPAAARP